MLSVWTNLKNLSCGKELKDPVKRNRAQKTLR